MGRLYPSDSYVYSIAISCIYNHLAWAGCVAYPCTGAMRRPEIRDGREVRNSHSFFISTNLRRILTAEFGSSGGTKLSRKMKKILWHLLSTMLCLMLIGLSSCGKDDEQQQPESQRTNPQQVTEDPKGTIELSMSVDGNTLDGLIKIDKDRNFSYAGNSYYSDSVCFASTGKVYGLGNVNYIPTAGWATKVAIREGYGYVAYNHSSRRFYRLYVEPVETIVEGSHDSGYNTDGGYYQTETTTSRNFYIVKYQAPFKGTDEEIMVPSASMFFKAEGGIQTLTFSNKNIVPFTYKSSQPWCRVTTSSTNEYNIPDGIAVDVDATASNKDETAIITLTTLFGKEKEITVTRAATGTIISPNGSFSLPTFSAMNNEPRLLYFSSNAEKSNINVSSNESWCQAKLKDISESETQNVRPVKFIGMKKTSSDDASSGHYYQLEVTVDDNVTETERKAEITLQSKDGNASYTIPIAQKGLTLGLQETELQVGASAQERYIAILGDVPTNLLQVSSNATWCKVSVIDATTNPEWNLGEWRSLLCVIEENASDESRAAVVTLKMKNGKSVHTLNVTQEGLSLRVSDTQISFNRKANYVTVNVSTNYSGWKAVSSDDSWCKLSSTATTLTIRVDPTTENREATISFEGFKTKITVKQNRYAIGDAFEEGKLSGTVGHISFDKNFIYKFVGYYQWSTENVPTGATSTTDGSYNMEIIKKIPDFEKYYPAFAACDALNVDDVSGWYLPAYYEVLFYDAWSSSERDASSSFSLSGYTDYSLKNEGGNYFCYNPKSYILSVYAIHLFE